jgi:Xaa-Pro aminopeptidase
LLKVTNKKFHQHIVSAEKLAVGWLETRSEKEMVLYPQICRIAHDIIRAGFSDKVIQPGVTTTEDVVWWYRERIKELRLDTWFHPSVSIQRNESDLIFNKRPQPVVIMPGDLLHVDFGITYLRLNTDTQQHAYMLRPEENDAPEYLKRALSRGNKLQDILTRSFAEGKTGNQILAETRKQAIDQGLTPSIYTHPIGYHGHAAGTTIGMWDMQGGVPDTGEHPMHANTAYSIELNVTVFIIEWKKEIQIKLEEDGFFDGATGFRYIDGRQTELILIPRPGRN